MEIIEVENLTKVYPGDIRAVDCISFSVREGEVFGFLGPNGAGKTTTIRMIVTLLSLTEGTIRVDGYDVEKNAHEIRTRIGYAAQSIGIDDDLTGRENLILQGRLHGRSRAQAAQKADELLEVMDLADAGGRRAGTYSGGMRRRLDLAQALVHEPRLLFLDEPTTGLDPQNRRALWNYLRNLNARGMTIFLTTQYLEEADTLADRLAIIDQGRIVVEGSPSQLKADLGGEAITVTVSEETADGILDQARTIMDGFSEDGAAKVYDHSVSAFTKDGSSRLPELVRRFDAADIPVARLEIAEPTLDDVFLRHTGERLRAEEEKQPSRMSRRRKHR